MKCTFELNNKGFLKQRESFDLEFKEAFHFGDPLFKYIRTIVGMANNKGGEIIFGIKDKPRIPQGMHIEKVKNFENCDSKRINQILNEYFSHEISWDMAVIEFHGN